MSYNLMPAGLRLLWVFAGLFLSLGLAYSTLTPIFENSDETLHYPYVKYLADGRGLPLAEPGRLWNQEGTQPPLYYALAAAATFWLDTDNLAQHLQYNPHWLFTEVRALINDNQNRVLHGPMDAFPYRRAALAIHLSRWLSLSFGLLTVICTFLIARHLFDSLPLAITATALTALTPQFIRVSATVSNDSLAAAIASLTVLLALKFTEPAQGLVQPGLRSATRFTNRQALLLGFLSGLALLTKLSSLATLLLAGFIIFWRLIFVGEIHDQPWQKFGRWLLLMTGTTLAMSGWWFVRNYSLYGEWLATDVHLNLAGRGYLSLPDLWQLRAEIERAYWATFGWGQIRPPEWVFQSLGWFTRLGLLGLGAGLVVKLIQGDRQKPVSFNGQYINFETIIFLLFWAALNTGLYLRWVTEVGSVSHTRLIFPAITAISLLLALGWHTWLPPRLEPGFALLATTGLLALNLYSLGGLIYPAFTPSQPDRLADAAGSGPVGLTFLDSLRLEQAGVYPGVPPALSAPQPGARPGDQVSVAAQWQTLASLDKNYSLSVVLLAPDGSVLARRETYPGLGLRPTRYLSPGETFVDIYPLTLDADVSEPMIARASVSLFDLESDHRAGLPAFDPAGNEVTPIVGQLKIVPAVWPQYQPGQPVRANFANAIALTGYDLAPAGVAGEMATLTLYWESLAPVDQDYSLFIHWFDAEGRQLGQADGPLTNNVYPTRWWLPGETIASRHRLPLPPNAVLLRLGLYSLSDGQRLPLTHSTLPGPDNSVEISLP